MQLGLLREGDWFGIVTMAVGLASLQAVLEEGNKDDWFGSPFIVKLAVIAAVSLSLFIANELIVEKPLLRLRLLTQRNFGMGTLAAVFLGFGLFGSIYLLPAYLGQVQRYNAEQIGTRAGLDRPAAAAPDPAGAEADAADRCALSRRIRADAVRLQLLHEHDDVAGLFGRSVLDSQHRARHRPGADAGAPEQRLARQRRAAGCGRGLRHLQHDAQSRRRDRHRGARDHRHQARAVPLQHHRPVRRPRPRGSAHPHRAR